MSTERWEKAQQIFHLAVDLAPAEKADFLSLACAGDPVLLEEVESLIRADINSGDYLRSAVEHEASCLFDAQLAGERLGAYRVLHEVGRGGMGSVFLAVRDDDAYQKRVAIKVVRRGMDTAEVLQRFRHERQILANLDHPFIARLHDGGTTPDGRPYFVMEFVEGKPIDRFCQEHSLDIKSKLRLFLRVCEAVSHAHRNLVIHRDLKPANIFVSKADSPKLLDFGVAKLLAGPNDQMTAAPGRLFTPEYASPEQVLGLPVTTAADVYSLGAVLYELLTGKRARKLSGVTPLEVDRAVCHTDIARPSRVASGLNADLDNIVLMAMSKEPERRYSSVDLFAEDIQHYLEGEPVTARPNSFGYRSRKLILRHSWNVGAAAVVLLGMVAATVVSVAQSRRAETERGEAIRQRFIAKAESRQAELARQSEASERRMADRERDEAQLQRGRAEQRLGDLLNLANRTLFDVHSAIEPLPGSLAARKSIVKTTLDYLTRLEREIGAEAAFARNDGGERLRLTLSSAYYKIGLIQGDPFSASLQDFDGARASFQKAESLLTPVYALHPADPDLWRAKIEIECGLTDILSQAGGRDAAGARIQAMLPLAHRLARARPSDVESVRQEPLLYGRIADAIHYTEPRRALENAVKQVELLQRLIHRLPDEAILKEDLSSSLTKVAAATALTGDLERAASYYRQSIDTREDLLQTNPHNNHQRRQLIVAYGNYAGVLGVPWAPNLGRLSEARAASSKAIALARENVAMDSQDLTSQVDLAFSLSRFGAIGAEVASLAESGAALHEAIAILVPLSRANPASRNIALQLATAREYLGYRLQDVGKLREARDQFLSSIEDVKPLIPSGNSSAEVQQIVDLEALAVLDAIEGDRSAALDHAQRALTNAELHATAHKSDSAAGHWAHAFFTVASVHATLKDSSAVKTPLERALTIWKSIYNPGLLSLQRDAIRQATALLHDLESHP